MRSSCLPCWPPALQRVKKESATPEPPCPSGPVDNATAIMAGELAGMVSTPIDTVLYLANLGYINWTFDLDQDGIPDVEIFMQSSYTLGAGPYQATWLKTLDPAISLRSYMASDTTFVGRDTLGTLVYVDYSCMASEETPNVSYIDPDKSHPWFLDAGDSLWVHDEFITDSVALYYDFGPGHQYQDGDYTIIPNSNFVNCQGLPLGTEKFLGLKFTGVENETRLAWIRMKQVSANELHVLEFSVQD